MVNDRTVATTGDRQMKTIGELLGGLIGLIFFGGWIFSVPLAFIYGDKMDVILSLLVPYYGVFVALT